MWILTRLVWHVWWYLVSGPVWPEHYWTLVTPTQTCWRRHLHYCIGHVPPPPLSCIALLVTFTGKNSRESSASVTSLSDLVHTWYQILFLVFSTWDVISKLNWMTTSWGACTEHVTLFDILTILKPMELDSVHCYKHGHLVTTTEIMSDLYTDEYQFSVLESDW